MLACAWPHVDNVVGGTYDLLLMLYDDDRIAQIAQLLEYLYQTVRITRVQADTRFVEYI